MIYRLATAAAATAVITSLALIHVANRRLEKAITNDEWSEALANNTVNWV